VSALKVDCMIPMGNSAGHVAVVIDIEQIESLRNADRQFINGVIDKLTGWTDRFGTEPAVRVAERQVPEVLRGLVRGSS